MIGSCADSDDDLSGDSKLCLVEIDGEYQDVELTVEPEYLNGGQEGYTDALLKAVLYPPLARENSVEGVVKIQYVITTLGSVEDVVMVENPGAGLGKATLEAFLEITEGVSFSPGELNKEKVNVLKDGGVIFRLE